MTNHRSLVTEIPAANWETASRYFQNRLAVETDVSDVRLDLERGVAEFVLVDVRSFEHFEECHIAGAVSLPYRTISEDTTAAFCKQRLIVVYCWGPACNAATKAAARLSALGFQVKEMLGGIEYWRREGGPIEGEIGKHAPLVG